MLREGHTTVSCRECWCLEWGEKVRIVMFEKSCVLGCLCGEDYAHV
jgi:hypothetical protein